VLSVDRPGYGESGGADDARHALRSARAGQETPRFSAGRSDAASPMTIRRTAQWPTFAATLT
jgi:hypothetical protein